jgi:hypothetical protein
MSQMIFAEAEYTHKKRKTPHETFPEKMDTTIPWVKLEKTDNILSKRENRSTTFYQECIG